MLNFHVTKLSIFSFTIRFPGLRKRSPSNSQQRHVPCIPTTVLAKGKVGECKREARMSHQVLITYSVQPKMPCQHAITMKTLVTFDVTSFKIQRILRISSPPALSGHADGMTGASTSGLQSPCAAMLCVVGGMGQGFQKTHGDLLSQHDCPQDWPAAPSLFPFPLLLLSQNPTHRSPGDSGSLTGPHPSARLPSSSPRASGAGALGGRHSHSLLRPQHPGL